MPLNLPRKGQEFFLFLGEIYIALVQPDFFFIAGDDLNASIENNKVERMKGMIKAFAERDHATVEEAVLTEQLSRRHSFTTFQEEKRL